MLDTLNIQISSSREELEKLIKANTILSELIISASQRLDLLIVEHVKITGTKG